MYQNAFEVYCKFTGLCMTYQGPVAPTVRIIKQLLFIVQYCLILRPPAGVDQTAMEVNLKETSYITFRASAK